MEPDEVFSARAASLANKLLMSHSMITRPNISGSFKSRSYPRRANNPTKDAPDTPNLSAACM